MKVRSKQSPLFVIFTTVLVDLIGFGMVIPLITLYGQHYGASGVELAVLGAIYSAMQFLFSPIWGGLSDRVGRRPILLLSLAGSTLAYLAFGLAESYTVLLLSRMFAGIFAANISTAQAYIADISKPEDRAKGMGMIGAAFGIGFTLGPPLGGIASAQWGLGAPGLIAAAICGTNFLIAWFRLDESLPKNLRNQKVMRSWLPINPETLKNALKSAKLSRLMLIFFITTFAFAMMEQTFGLLIKDKLNLLTSETGLKTGLVLMWSGILGAIIQGGLIRKWAPLYGEMNLLKYGLIFNLVGMAVFPLGSSYWIFYILIIPLAIGSALINPSLSASISKSVGPTEQGQTLGLSLGLGSLARAVGPFTGLLGFDLWYALPFSLAAILCGFAIWMVSKIEI